MDSENEKINEHCDDQEVDINKEDNGDDDDDGEEEGEEEEEEEEEEMDETLKNECQDSDKAKVNLKAQVRIESIHIFVINGKGGYSI